MRCRFGSLADKPSRPESTFVRVVQKRTNAAAARMSAKCQKQTWPYPMSRYDLNSFVLGDENGGPFELTDSQVIECIVGTHEGIDVRRCSHARPLRDAKKFIGVITGEIGN